MKKLFRLTAKIYLILMVVSALSSVAAQVAKTNESEVDNKNKDRIEGRIVRVIDGDTFVVYLTDKTVDIKCRLIGVDTPESVHSDESRNIPEGKVASDFTKDLLPVGTTIWLEYDVGENDTYGRELVYAYLADGRMVQEILLAEGYARTMTIAPNVKYAEHFAALQSEARNSGAGFWHNLSELFAEE